ncbi:MAG: DUF1559 domain-containing protein [Pirellulales bacterium]|nr:DUF1559 domain-containing protein [Pirellulales bacterium]
MKAARNGFTLVELLVVIAIIGVLVALLLPAVQAAREASRSAQCKNHVKQLALAMVMHEQAQGRLPSAGFNGDWVGDPDLGFGLKQPAGWVFAILPYIEQTSIRTIGAGMAGVDKRKELARRDAMAIEFLNCPSRRNSQGYPNPANHVPINGRDAALHGRSDYAQNAGDIKELEQWCHTNSPRAVGDAGGAAWPPALDLHSGVGFCGATIKLRNITDGLSNTYAVGDRFIEPQHYENGLGHADDWPMYTGYQDDLYRSVYHLPGDESYTPLRDQDGVGGARVHFRFGSAHPGGCNLAMCDGSVQSVSYDIDPEVHRQSGHRSDGGAPREAGQM